MPKSVLTIKEIVNVIEIYKNEKLSACELAKKKSKISKTKAACIIKKKDEILRLWYTYINPVRKRSMLKPMGLYSSK